MRRRSDASMSHESPDTRISALATRQHGVLSRSQAISCGASRTVIQRRVSTGRWERVHPGVYRLAGVPQSWRQSLTAACLGASGAVISHRSAAALWAIVGFAEGLIEITVPRGVRLRLPGVFVHESASIPRIDRSVVDGLPVTSPTRTLIDVASVATDELVEEALDDVLRRRLSSISWMRSRLSRLGTKGRPGSALLSALLDERDAARTIPQSRFETKALRVFREGKLPRPHCQYELRQGGRLVAILDFAWPALRVAVETDGFQFHTGKRAWRRDLHRGNALTVSGWDVLHVTWEDLMDDPARIVATIRHMLTARGAIHRPSATPGR